MFVAVTNDAAGSMFVAVVVVVVVGVVSIVAYINASHDIPVHLLDMSFDIERPIHSRLD